jgi:hypothetical protein
VECDGRRGLWVGRNGVRAGDEGIEGMKCTMELTFCSGCWKEQAFVKRKEGYQEEGRRPLLAKG